MKILVLDDHAGFRHEVAAILEKHGHTVHEAETAADAVPLVENGEYDFVLVDYSMPVHDGLWFVENVKKTPRTKILMMTAQRNIYVALAMIRAGGDGYIIKPFDEQTLLHHLDFYSQSTELTLMAAGAHH